MMSGSLRILKKTAHRDGKLTIKQVTNSWSGHQLQDQPALREGKKLISFLKMKFLLTNITCLEQMISIHRLKRRSYQIHLSKLYRGLPEVCGLDSQFLNMVQMSMMNTGWWEQLAMHQWAWLQNLEAINLTTLCHHTSRWLPAKRWKIPRQSN